MRLSIKTALAGFLVSGALALSAMGAEAMGSGGGNSNGPDAYIGIVGGSPQQYTYSANGNINSGGAEANVNRGANDGERSRYNSGSGYHTGY
jgi:hypothetical protein